MVSRPREVLMGNFRSTYQRLGWGGVPDTDRATYFNERLMMGWYELLCIPAAMGCTVVWFEPKNAMGGPPQYKIKLRLSYSEYVPRYQLHIVQNRSTKPWIVGHIEKTETHLRAKHGEFCRVQVWKLTCNAVVWEERRSSTHRKTHLCFNAVKERPTPSAIDMQMMGMTIAMQAKASEAREESGRNVTKSSEKWNQVFGVKDKAYKVSIGPPPFADQKNHKEMESMNVLKIVYGGKSVCVARKQRFAGTLGKVCQPYLGVQIKPPEKGTVSETLEGAKVAESLLDTQGLMYLLMCLAWSEETMSPHLDMTDQFIKAMRAPPGMQYSAEWLGLSVQWDTDDVRDRLSHIPYAAVHNWADESRPAHDPDLEAQTQEESDKDPESQGPSPDVVGRTASGRVIFR